MRKIPLLAVALLLLLAGCGSKATDSSTEVTGAMESVPVVSSTQENNEPDNFYTFTDDLGREVVLKEKPERVILLTPSLLDMHYQVGGTVVGAPSIAPHLKMDELREKVKDVPDLGHFAENMEAVFELDPDLVIGFPRIHDKYIDLFEQSNIPFAIVRATSYDDTIRLWDMFGNITGEHEKAAEQIRLLNESIDRLKGALEGNGLNVAILEVTVRDVTLERTNSITGNMLEILGVHNIVSDFAAMEGRPDKVPFSMETLIEKDPDVILFKTMGPVENLQEMFEKELESNPAWKNLTAVKDNRLEYLPQEQFLVHPGSKYEQSLEYLVEILQKYIK